ncbi:MAG: hypothetical protein WAX37_02285 [Minisyncoccia bacterium]
MLKDVTVFRVYGWDEAGYLPAVVRKVNGRHVKMVPQVYAERVKADWDRSCPPIEATSLIGIPKRSGNLSHLIEKGVVKTLNPFGKGRGLSRVLLSSIPAAQKYVAGSAERMRRLREKLGRVHGHRWTSAEATKNNLSKGKFVNFLHNPFHSPQLYMLVPDTSVFMGVSVEMVRRWTKEKKLRLKKLRGRTYVETESIRTHRLRMIREFNSFRRQEKKIRKR